MEFFVEGLAASGSLMQVSPLPPLEKYQSAFAAADLNLNIIYGLEEVFDFIEANKNPNLQEVRKLRGMASLQISLGAFAVYLYRYLIERTNEAFIIVLSIQDFQKFAIGNENDLLPPAEYFRTVLHSYRAAYHYGDKIRFIFTDGSYGERDRKPLGYTPRCGKIFSD